MGEEQKDQTVEQEDKRTAAHYFNFSEVLGYFFRKKDPNRKTNINLKMMHGINKISILMFLFAVIVMVVRWVNRM
ncbi:MAG: hypothetical protein RIF33_26265 [Cyclobacteriaceae bacterium]